MTKVHSSPYSSQRSGCRNDMQIDDCYWVRTLPLMGQDSSGMHICIMFLALFPMHCVPWDCSLTLYTLHYISLHYVPRVMTFTFYSLQHVITLFPRTISHIMLLALCSLHCSFRRVTLLCSPILCSFSLFSCAMSLTLCSLPYVLCIPHGIMLPYCVLLYYVPQHCSPV